MNTISCIKRNKLLIRFISYISLWYGYVMFMAKNSYLGVNWLEFHTSRIENAVNHILTQSDFTKFGITSWTDIGNNSRDIIYSVQAHEYLHYTFLMKIGGFELLNKYGPLLDKLIIFVLCSITAELCIYLLKNKSNIFNYMIGIWSFLIIATLPYTYRMFLSLWQDVYMLAFTMLSYYLFSKNKKYLGFTVLIYALMWQYHWALLLGFYYLFIRFYYLLTSSKKFDLYPPGFRNCKSSTIFTLCIFISPLITTIQTLAIKISNITLLNNSFLYRVGIDSIKNIHHGGIIAGLQFLGGNRLSLCLKPPGFIDQIITNQLELNIYKFNCITAITGMIVISIIGIIGYIIFISSQNDSLWITLPLPITFFIFTLIFQQAMAAHLQGHSIFFAPILTFGIINLVTSIPKINNNHPISLICCSTLIAGIIINNIKVSYLTGVNG